MSLESLNGPSMVFSPLWQPTITLFLNGRSQQDHYISPFFLIAGSESKTEISGTSGVKLKDPSKG